MMNSAKDNKKLNQVFQDEGESLLNAWLDEAFKEKLNKYMMTLMEQRS